MRFTDDEHLFLPAPPAASVPATTDSGHQGVADVLKILRHQLARPLTRGRVQRFKADWLRRAGADEALIGFLTVVSPGNRAQMRYTCMARSDLTGWHLLYLERGLGLMVQDWTLPEGVYGTRLRIPHEFLAAIFADARKDVAAKQPPGPGSTRQVRDLPKRYEVNSGFVIDSLGARSDQIDLVIYDKHFTPTLLDQQSHRYIPAEAVYAVFEAKPEPRRVCRRLIDLSYAAISDLSRAA